MMEKSPAIVFATNNSHKLEEARRIAGGRIRILSLADINCHDEIPETAPDLEGNSLQKARWIKSRYGFDCFADDTGLFVEALGGRRASAPSSPFCRMTASHSSLRAA